MLSPAVAVPNAVRTWVLSHSGDFPLVDRRGGSPAPPGIRANGCTPSGYFRGQALFLDLHFQKGIDIFGA